jgi:hypothetical protein
VGSGARITGKSSLQICDGPDKSDLDSHCCNEVEQFGSIALMPARARKQVQIAGFALRRIVAESLQK